MVILIVFIIFVLEIKPNATTPDGETKPHQSGRSANITRKKMTANRKPIKVRYGCVKKLAESCNVSEVAVRRALKWERDTDTQRLIRKRARELGYIRLF